MKKYLIAIVLLLIPALCFGWGLCGTLSGGAPAGDMSYDLDATWTAGNQTFSGAQVLDTSAEGVDTGSMTVFDDSTGTVKIDTNRLEIVGSGVLNHTGVYLTSGFTKALGKAAFMTFTHNTATDCYMGFITTAGITEGSMFGTRFTFNDNLNVTAGNAGSPSTRVGVVVDAVQYKVLFLAGGYNSTKIPFNTGDTVADFKYGYQSFIKGGIYTNWTRLWLNPQDNTTPLYIVAQTPSDTQYYVDFLIPTNTLNSNTMFVPAYLSTSTDESDHDTGVSDFLLEVVFDTPPSGTDPLDIRYRKAGTNSHWILRVTPGTAGTDLEIIEDNGGETQRATSDVDWATSTEYRVVIIVDGDSNQRVTVDSSIEIEYTTTNTFNETETIVDLLKNSFTVDMLAVHNRTDGDWDTAISIATDSTY